MRTKIDIFARALALVAALAVSFETSTVIAAETAKPAPPAKPPLVKFRPPPPSTPSGKPSVRVTGGSRGSGETALTLDVLAPDQVGETTQEQPSLFWFQSRPATAKFELTVLQENKVKPVVQFTVERATQAGIQRLKLADHNAKLAPGVEYQWIVALISDPDNRSTDLVASGVIKRIVPSPELKEKIAKATPDTLAGIYAESGIWHDALALLSDQIEAHPNDKTLRQTRADLLRQVGLSTAAQFESPTKDSK